MVMKIVTYVIIALLVLTLGAGAFFYLQVHQPLAADLARMKAGLPELDRAKTELKKLKEKESRELNETAWLSPAVDTMNTGLANEIKAGLAEVFLAGNNVVVNISENALFMPGAYTFAKESPQLRTNIADLLKNNAFKGKIIVIGNTTKAVPARGKGRKKTPAKDARMLAGERSSVLVKDLEKSGVNPDALVAAAYPATQPVLGFKIKDLKTVIIIENPPMLPQVAPKQNADSGASSQVSATTTAPATPSASQTQQKSIPIQPKAQ